MGFGNLSPNSIVFCSCNGIELTFVYEDGAFFAELVQPARTLYPVIYMCGARKQCLLLLPEKQGT